MLPNLFPKLTRDLVVLDLEATGLDVTNDAIFEFGAIRYTPLQPEPTRVLIQMKPWKEVPDDVAEAIGRVGINDALDNCHPFATYAKGIATMLKDCDFAGYNLRRFDLPLLQEELHRCGIEFDPTQAAIVDAGTIFMKKEERTLTAAQKFYCGKEHKDAHSALADTEATAEVLAGQLAMYPDLSGMTMAELGKFSQRDDYVDLAGKFAKDKNGAVIFTFGQKTKGQPVLENASMLQWMMDKSFTQDTKRWCRKFLDQIYGNVPPASDRELF